MPFPPKDIYAEFSEVLVGLTCASVEHPSDWYWQIVFGADEKKVTFGIETTWRLLVDGTILFGDGDHGQKFGLPKPVDIPDLCMKTLGSSLVTTATVVHGPSDVIIKFDNGSQLEIVNSSSGYENWSCHFDGIHIVAMGGGELAIFRSAKSLAAQQSPPQEKS